MSRAPQGGRVGQPAASYAARPQGVAPISALLPPLSPRKASRPKNSLPYGRVFFAVRERLGLTNDAYLLADVVCTLARASGWCYASSEYLAATLGISTRQLRRHLAMLASAGLVERRGRSRRQLRTTRAWEAAKASAMSGHEGHPQADKMATR